MNAVISRRVNGWYTAFAGWCPLAMRRDKRQLRRACRLTFKRIRFFN